MRSQNNPLCSSVISMTSFLSKLPLSVKPVTHHLPISLLFSVPDRRLIISIPVMSYLDTPKTKGVVLCSLEYCMQTYFNVH